MVFEQEKPLVLADNDFPVILQWWDYYCTDGNIVSFPETRTTEDFPVHSQVGYIKPVRIVRQSEQNSDDPSSRIPCNKADGNIRHKLCNPLLKKTRTTEDFQENDRMKSEIIKSKIEKPEMIKSETEKPVTADSEIKIESERLSAADYMDFLKRTNLGAQ